MKIQVKNYTFNKTNKTVTFTDYADIRLDSILLVVNATRNIIMYNFSDPDLGGTVATNVLTLAYDTSAMSNNDKILIIPDDEDAVQNINLSTSLAALSGGVENDNVGIVPFRRLDAWDDADTDDDLTTQAVVQAGVASKRIYVTDITISVDGPMLIILQDEDDTLVLPLLFPAAGIYSKTFAVPKQLGIDKDLEIKSDTAGDVYWSISGYQI